MVKITRSGRALIPVTNRGYVLGEQHHRAKLTDDDVRLILALRAEGMAQHEIATKFECSRRTVRDIEAGKIRCTTPDGYQQAKRRARREHDRLMASRWPCRIKPAKPEEFD